jgi:hypothetical protein
LAEATINPLDTILTFAPGETSKTVTVNVLDESLFESDESFFVELSNAKGRRDQRCVRYWHDRK